MVLLLVAFPISKGGWWGTNVQKHSCIFNAFLLTLTSMVSASCAVTFGLWEIFPGSVALFQGQLSIVTKLSVLSLSNGRWQFTMTYSCPRSRMFFSYFQLLCTGLLRHTCGPFVLHQCAAVHHWKWLSYTDTQPHFVNAIANTVGYLS